ncbi:hypothetical protein ACLOJK_040220 [Asimina triloba]
MSAMLKEQLVKVFSLMKPGFLFQYEPELDAFLEFLIWRFSIWVDKPTPGNALMNLRYRDERAVPLRGKEVERPDSLPWVPQCDIVRFSAHQLPPGSSPNHTYWRGPALIPFVTGRLDYNAPGSKGPALIIMPLGLRARPDYNSHGLLNLGGNDRNNLRSGGQRGQYHIVGPRGGYLDPQLERKFRLPPRPKIVTVITPQIQKPRGSGTPPVGVVRGRTKRKLGRLSGRSTREEVQIVPQIQKPRGVIIKAGP